MALKATAKADNTDKNTYTTANKGPATGGPAKGSAANGGRGFFSQQLKLFLVLALFWIVLSERFEPVFLTIGLLTIAAATWLSRDVMLLSKKDEHGFSQEIHGLDFPVIPYIKYWTWLIVQIFIANFQIAYVVLHPRLPINPQVVAFRQPMKSPLAHLSLGNSITLTPGTLTVDIEEDGTYIIHALTNETAAALYFENGQGEVRERIAALFSEEVPTDFPDTPIHVEELQDSHLQK